MKATAPPPPKGGRANEGSKSDLPPLGGGGADLYTTLAAPAQFEFTEKRSRFLAFALHVSTPEEALARVKDYEREYYDARHVCYAYALGPDADTYRANDNGEPSGTAGRPILGAIRSAGLTDVLVVVVRYFGGVKLGTGGLAVAYKTAAAEALAKAPRRTCTVDVAIDAVFPFTLTQAVMRVVKDRAPRIEGQDYTPDGVTLHLRERQSRAESLLTALNNIYGVKAMKHILTLLLTLLLLTACHTAPATHHDDAPAADTLQEAPDFAFTTLAGETTTLSALRGRYIVLDFWGTWCPWCVKGMPRMAQTYEQHSDQLEIIGIACQDNEMDVRDFIREHDITWTQTINDDDDDEASPRALYHVEAFPTKVIIDPDGYILATYQGESPDFYTHLERILNAE